MILEKKSMLRYGLYGVMAGAALSALEKTLFPIGSDGFAKNPKMTLMADTGYAAFNSAAAYLGARTYGLSNEQFDANAFTAGVILGNAVVDFASYLSFYL